MRRRTVRDWSPGLGDGQEWLEQLESEGWVPEYGAGVRVRINGHDVLATELDPDAKRARPHLARGGLLRLLAFNAEAWLAEHLNAYLADPDEYCAITRNLLHQGGQVNYTTSAITVTLDRPDSPRVARALTLLTDELNHTPARLPGDRRAITCQVAQAQKVSTQAPRLPKEV